MNLSTLIVLIPVVALVVISIRYLAHGGMNSCAGCGSQSSCAGKSGCKWTKDIAQAKREIARERKISQKA